MNQSVCKNTHGNRPLMHRLRSSPVCYGNDWERVPVDERADCECEMPERDASEWKIETI